MCGDNDFVECELPRKTLDMVCTAWADFKRDPSDHAKFEAMHFLICVASAKWGYYATSRMCAASRNGRAGRTTIDPLI
ncbi:MAG: hypothetical protein MUC33_01170 [Desulfobacterales bacterium]|jgi:hypothetical protein|nr:hypothetical protein [Desulfobacterales bacterium]MCU0601253.1 hypothetical protein [Desulfobacterales bacterium]